MLDRLKTLYNTGCVPLNMYLVWTTLVVVTALVTLVRVYMRKQTLNLNPQVTGKELLISLAVAIVAVVILGAIFRGLCEFAGGQVIGLLVALALLVATGWVTADILTAVEVNAYRWLKPKFSRFTFSKKTAAPVKLSELPSDTSPLV